MNNVAYGLVMQELERGDSGLRSFASVQGSLVMYPIHSYGSDAQKERWLPELAAGARDRLLRPHRARLRAATRARCARARCAAAAAGCSPARSAGSPTARSPTSRSSGRTTEDGVRGFLVEKGRRGFEARDIKGKFSLRGSVTSELFLSDVEVPEENRLPKAEGLRGPLSCLTQARYGIAWGAIGAAMACYDEALQYSLAREVQGGPLAGKQLTQEKLVVHAHRDHQGPAARAARRPAQGRGPARPRDGLAGQAQQRRRGAPDRARSRATCSARTASSTSTRRCATW